MDTEEILCQDLFNESILFDFSTPIPLSTTVVAEFKKDSNLSTHEIVDLMSYVRQHGGNSSSKTFSTAINSVLNLIQLLTKHETLL